MPDSIRIRTTPNGSDKYVKVKLEQDFDFIEILSLKISQEDVYRRFCSDYGVIVGRVTVNNGFGVPNAKVSVFIPLDDVDKNDTEIAGLYPYTSLSDKNSDGVRYNLLPKDGNLNNDCFTPIGTFPNKREVLDNPTMLQVYCKYYEFTTTTNHAGDFMIFGVPLGSYTVHLDADISDIGVISQRPYDLINEGSPIKSFDSPTKFKPNKDLNKLIQIKTMNAGVNVQPFWGDAESCQIGITRLDFPLNYTVKPTAIFVGSIFGDTDKHSVNKRCRPRRGLGVLCEQVTGEGTINMIRKTQDGQIEAFDVEGGRVIDANGAWAYQIPMNLDYMVTNEDGTLSYSSDPNIGLPTKASVRFKISMDETGGEGRLRTRAKYLVPNNPQNPSEIDYTFGPATDDGPATKDSSFKDLYWNQIYTVSNYIPRFQTSTMVNVRGFTGVKEVDDCVGNKNPFPYNRVNTTINPMFFIICLIVSIFSVIIWFINKFIIWIVNKIIRLIRYIISGLCNFLQWLSDGLSYIGLSFNLPGFCSSQIPLVECITIKCPSDDGQYFAPGCTSDSDGYAAADVAGHHPSHYPDDGHAHEDDLDVGLTNCIGFQVAESLGMFQFNFFNDWVNGTLFSYLLKYKKKRKRRGKPGREKFCEYECDGGNFTPVDGVDVNGDGDADNPCHDNYLVDVNFDNLPSHENCEDQESHIFLNDGLIKKVGTELIYAVTTHNGMLPLFATDIVNLGSILDCDWRGVPKINDYLIPTSYIAPPDVSEYSDDGLIRETCGMCSLDSQTNSGDGMFFTINCLGLHVNWRQGLNVRHQCEIGVDLDVAQQVPPNTEVNANCILSIEDIDDGGGVFFRDVFYGLNNGSPWNNNHPTWNTNFNLNNTQYYNFANTPDNGLEYKEFRYGSGTIPIDGLYPTKHSFYFYFGLLPGKTGLDKMNSSYFTKCKRLIQDDMIISSQVVADTYGTNNGSITFNAVGGTGPFTYTVTGPNYQYPTTGIATLQANGGNSDSATLTGLGEGTYIITIIDSLGTMSTQTVVISGVPTMTANVFVSQHATTSVSLDGKITIGSVNGGTSPYYYKVHKVVGTPVQIIPLTQFTVGTLTAIITGLGVQQLTGYTVTIVDSSTPQQTYVAQNLKINGPDVLTLSTVDTDISCPGLNDGTIQITVGGGIPPYTFNTIASGGYTSNLINLEGLGANIYTTTVSDSSPVQQTQTVQTNISNLSPVMTITPAALSVLKLQCDPSVHKITFNFTTTFGNPTLWYKVDSDNWAQLQPTVNGSTYTFNVPTLITSQLALKAKFNNCETSVVSIPAANIKRPTVQLGGTLTMGTTGGGNHDGSITVNPTGGIAPYTVKWFKNVNNIWAYQGYTINPTLALAPGNYDSQWRCEITDSVGCVFTTAAKTIT